MLQLFLAKPGEFVSINFVNFLKGRQLESILAFHMFVCDSSLLNVATSQSWPVSASYEYGHLRERLHCTVKQFKYISVYLLCNLLIRKGADSNLACHDHKTLFSYVVS